MYGRELPWELPNNSGAHRVYKEKEGSGSVSFGCRPGSPGVP
jgi:hypothetical protein